MARFSLKEIAFLKKKVTTDTPSVSGIHPDRDWKLILYTTIILILIVVIFDGYLFLQVNSGEAIFFTGKSVRIKERTVSYEELNSIIDFYKNKKSQFSSLTEEVPNIIDPSL